VKDISKKQRYKAPFVTLESRFSLNNNTTPVTTIFTLPNAYDHAVLVKQKDASSDVKVVTTSIESGEIRQNYDL
jgi:hypothetical protein